MAAYISDGRIPSCARQRSFLALNHKTVIENNCTVIQIVSRVEFLLALVVVSARLKSAFEFLINDDGSFPLNWRLKVEIMS